MVEAQDILLDLLAIRSEPTDSMEAVVEYAVHFMRGVGMEVKVVDGDFPVVLARRGEGGVLFSGHLDTVPRGSGWSKAQGERVGGRIYGRGAADMKGPCAAIMAAAANLAGDDIPLSIILTTDEETTMGGARRVADSDPVAGASFILVCEPTDLRIAYTEKGLYHVRLTTSGKAAHGSMPHLGVSAIWGMYRLLDQLRELTEAPGNPMDSLTVNVGTISGGTKVNVVPAECAAELDLRFPPSLRLDDVRSLLDEKLGACGIPYEVEEMQKLRAVASDTSSEGIRRLREISGGELMAVPYGTEMAIYHPHNPRTAIFGPGRVEAFHAADECIDVEDLGRAAETYEAFARSMA
jgi:acetylornithine deacetylase/succinyl-diaminopimelate desuccinylase-like protein